jgi:hypothetical protein
LGDGVRGGLRLEEVVDSSVCCAKGADVLANIVEVLRVAGLNDAHNARFDVKASFRDEFSSGNDLRAFKFMRKRNDARRGNAIVRERIKGTGDVEFRGEAFVFVVLLEDMFDVRCFRFVAFVDLFVKEVEFEGAFEAIKIGIIVDFERVFGVFGSRLEDFPISFEMS